VAAFFAIRRRPIVRAVDDADIATSGKWAPTVVGVIDQDTVHIVLVHRPRPTLDHRSDTRLIVSHGFVPSRMPLLGGALYSNVH